MLVARDQIKENNPLVYHITNYVTVNDCANIVLACGGSPIMTDEIKEIDDIVAMSSSVVINIGTLNMRTIEAMVAAGKAANRLDKPVVLDPVGAGASALRNETVRRLLQEVEFTVIRGNLSEIKAVALGHSHTKGVDVAKEDYQDQGNVHLLEMMKQLSRITKAIIVVSGKNDFVVDSQRAVKIANGHPMMAMITGSGCMLSSVIGCYLGVSREHFFDGVVTAVCAMGICGELAYEDGIGTSCFRMRLIDQMSLFCDEHLRGGGKIEYL